jgi:ABC-2 type transport system permease protein
MTAERMYFFMRGGLLVFFFLPLFQIGTLALIYGGSSSALFRYALVAQVANLFVLNTIFWVGEILDRERVRGTLVPLFLAPCSRFAWLAGYTAAGLAETLITASVLLLIGRYGFGVRFDANLPALALTSVLFVAALWGMGLVFSGLGLLVKQANPLANLIFNLVLLIGGAYYPVAQLPDWLRYPARALPLGYGMQALADAALNDSSIHDIASDLVPLTGFALILPLLGMLAFTWIERLIRIRGELDVY